MISVIIAHRNDKQRLFDTVRSIRMTEDQECEIIVVDDCSDLAQVPIEIEGVNQIKYFNNQVGPGQCRDAGARAASGNLLVFTDSHMRWPAGWDLLMMDGIGEYDLVCAKCRMPGGQVWKGAGFVHVAVEMVTAEGKAPWQRVNLAHIEPYTECPFEDEPEIPCVVGAFYVIHRGYFHTLDGFNGLYNYGGDEQLLSWKVHLSGGRVRCNQALTVDHLDEGRQADDIDSYIGNKMLVERMLFDQRWPEFCDACPDWMKPIAEKYSYAYRMTAGCFRHRIVYPDEISKQFGLQTLDEALDLLSQIREVKV